MFQTPPQRPIAGHASRRGDAAYGKFLRGREGFGDQDIHSLSATGLSRVLLTNRPLVSDDFGVDERFSADADPESARTRYGEQAA